MRPSRFSSRLATRQSGQTNNHPESLRDKIEIRLRVFNAVGSGAVFDAYAGGGEMYRAVWKNAARYVGCDEQWFNDERMMYTCDCRRLLRTLSLQSFSIFDFDSYGSPWDCAIILAARRRVAPGERIGVVLTEGSGFTLKFGGLPKGLAALAGFGTLRVPGAIRSRKEIATRAINGLADRLHCRVQHLWRAEREKQSAMFYLGIVLVGQ